MVVCWVKTALQERRDKHPTQRGTARRLPLIIIRSRRLSLCSSSKQQQGEREGGRESPKKSPRVPSALWGYTVFSLSLSLGINQPL